MSEVEFHLCQHQDPLGARSWILLVSRVGVHVCQKRDLSDVRSGVPLLSELQSHWCQKMDSIGVRYGILIGVRNEISIMSEVGSILLLSELGSH